MSQTKALNPNFWEHFHNKFPWINNANSWNPYSFPTPW
jgi:hypothetical protein